MTRTSATDHPIDDLLATRWSPRAFTDDPISPDTLRENLAARERTPSTRRPLAEIAFSGSWDTPL